MYPVAACRGRASSLPDGELLTAADTSAYWKLEEASGTRADSGPNGFNATAVNTPGNAAGKVNNAIDCIRASEQYVTVGDNSLLRFSADRTVCCWAKLDNKDNTQCIIGKYSATAFEWILSYEPGVDRWRAYMETTATAANVPANTFGSPSASTWYFLTMMRDGTNIRISVNAGAFDSGGWTGDYSAVFAPLFMGHLPDYDYALDGNVDEVVMFNRVLTQAEIDWLYNSGSGRALT